jgi:putative membrane protein
MHVGNHYSFREFFFWTRKTTYALFFLAAIPTVLFKVFGWHWLAIPWVPIAMIGTAAAFIVGFKNTQTYNRLWEARQNYGAIVTASRSWGIITRDFVKDPAAAKTLVYRHLAWITALRFQLREPRLWENTNKSYNLEYKQFYTIPEKESKIEVELQKFLSEKDLGYILEKKDRATQLISLQSMHIKQLKEDGLLDQPNYAEMQKNLAALFEHQGKCERIKNFPYPRQFASINKFFITLFICVVPFGLLNEFQKMGEHLVWLNIPFSMVVCWVFSSMERVGEATENPFEGGANDVPITALSRTIEIDLREMLDEKELPPALQPVNNILM